MVFSFIFDLLWVLVFLDAFTLLLLVAGLADRPVALGT